MLIHILGSAAGGGFPQWNCGCANCRAVRSGTGAARARTQTSVAIQASGGSWFLIHASPDIRAQMAALPALQPRALRDSPVAGILLTNGDLDQCLGLFSLREAQPLHLYATDTVRRGLTEGNRFFRALDRMPGQVTWHELKLNAGHTLMGSNGRPALSVTAVAVPGKVPLYLDQVHEQQPDGNIALLFRDLEHGRTFAHAPCVGGWTAAVERLVNESDCLFFDGTFWSEEELPGQGIGTRTARDMAHWPVGGAQGSLGLLKQARASRRVLVHINNTNPLLLEDSPERRQVNTAGIEVAHDGMEITV